MAKNACPGCGVLLEDVDGPTHDYMLSTPACWKLFGKLLAAEYESAVLMEVHRLTVDTYAVQHPGDGSRRAIQSVGLHLARLSVQLETPRSPKETNDTMTRFAGRKKSFIELDPPKHFSMTIADVAPFAGSDTHAQKVQEWARSAWNDWREHHDYILDWAGGSNFFRDRPQR